MNTGPANDRTFTRKRQDAALGLVNFENRYYDPQAGRFISADPRQLEPAPLQAMRLVEWGFQSGSASPADGIPEQVRDWQGRTFEPQDLNRFSYVLNNPLNRVDVDGYGFWKWVKKFVLKVLSSVISIVMQALFMAILPIPLPGFGLSDAFWDTLGQMAANPFVIGADAATYASTQQKGGIGFHGYLVGAKTTMLGLSVGLAAIAVGAMQGKHVGIHAESVGGQGTIVFSGTGFVMGKASAQTIGHAMLLKVERNGIRKGWNFHDWVSHESLHLQQAGVLGDGYVASHVTMGMLAMMFGRELKDDQGNVLRDKWHDPKINFLEDHENDSPWKWGRWP
ncbi:MAG: RHS repeat-associated core domain-containing protein [Deltaproteobacteria bacterium]|nr:RHS repeat-associated core domain-containing protein [Deltaproteobacteria bacterium]